MDPRLSQARSIIDALPWRQKMKEHNINRWLEFYMDNEPERIVWHAKRMGSIGGSEIGVLVADIRNKEATELDTTIATFKSAWDIIASKLCVSLPEQSGDDASRGIHGEAFLSDILVKQLSNTHQCKVIVDQDSINTMSGGLNHPEYPWLEGNIDLSLLINNTHRVLADIKWPRSGRAQEMQYDSPFEYICQLHHYNLKAKLTRHPIHFDSMMIAAFDSDTFQFYPAAVEFDHEIENDIIRAGNYFYNNYLMQGKLPAFPKSRTPIGSAFDLPTDVKQLIDTGLSLKAIESTVRAKLDENNIKLTKAMTKLGGPVEKYNLSTGPGSLSSKVKFKYDIKKLESLAKELNIIPDTYSVDNSNAVEVHKLLLKSTDRVTEYSLAQATNPQQTFSTTVTRKQKGPQFEALSGAKSIASSMINKAIIMNSSFMNEHAEVLEVAVDKEVIASEAKVQITSSEITVEKVNTQNSSGINQATHTQASENTTTQAESLYEDMHDEIAWRL